MSVGVVGGIVAAGTAIYGATASASASKSASRRAARTEAARLDFEKQQYEDWQETYGGLEDNLAAYYEELTPTLRTMQGLEAFEKEKNVAMTTLRETLAQRGISTSGIAAQTETNVAMSSATERARIRAAAPMETAKEKLSFLQVGLGQNPGVGMSDALGASATNAANVATSTANAAANAIPTAINATVDVAEQLYDVFNKIPGAK